MAHWRSLNMNYIAAMKERRAVRTFYKDRALSEGQIAEIQRVINDSKSPFGGEIAVKIHHFDLSKKSPNTYGSVEGASWYVLVGCDRTPRSLLTLGFCMTQVALKIFSMGLGTNMITATFKGSSFIPAANFPENLPLTVLMPFGVPRKKFRLSEWLTHFFLGSRKRKPFSELFGKVAHSSPLRQPLEMMRIASSAYNRQPWRAIVQNDMVWFYQVPSHNAEIGMGNGLCQFYFTLKENGYDGVFSDADNAPHFEGAVPVTKFILKAQQ